MAANLDDLFEEKPREFIGSLSVEDAIREFVKCDRRVKEAASDRQWPASIIAQAAQDERTGTQKTVHMETFNRDQKVKVEFKSELQVIDESQMETVRQLLGDERFFELFKIAYAPRAKALNSFLNTGSTNEQIKTAKQIIKESVKEVQKTPYVSVEKS